MTKFFYILVLTKFFFFLDWRSDVFVPSVFINETLFFSVSKHKIYLVWNQVVGTQILTFILSMLIQSFIEETFSQWIKFDSVISTQYLMFRYCFEDQCSKWILFLNSVPVDLMTFVGLRSDFFFLLIDKDFYLILKNCTNLYGIKPRKIKTTD